MVSPITVTSVSIERSLSPCSVSSSKNGGHTPETPTALSLTFGAEEIIVRPDDVLIRPDGSRTLRRIQTGHFAAEADDVGAAAFFWRLVRLSRRGGRAYPLIGPDCTAARPVGEEASNPENKLSGFLEEIRGGRFPAKASSRTCRDAPPSLWADPDRSIEKYFG